MMTWLCPSLTARSQTQPSLTNLCFQQCSEIDVMLDQSADLRPVCTDLFYQPRVQLKHRVNNMTSDLPVAVSCWQFGCGILALAQPTSAFWEIRCYRTVLAGSAAPVQAWSLIGAGTASLKAGGVDRAVWASLPRSFIPSVRLSIRPVFSLSIPSLSGLQTLTDLLCCSAHDEHWTLPKRWNLNMSSYFNLTLRLFFSCHFKCLICFL